MKKIIWQYIIPIFLSVGIVIIGYYFMHGIPLIGIPKMEDVSYVEISDSRLNIDARKFIETEDIEIAVNITNFLNYRLGTPNQEESFIQITFVMKDGTTVTVSANEETVYWNGKVFTIKGDNGRTFVSITEGLFFYDVLAEKETVQ